MTPNKCKCNWYPSVVYITDQFWGHTLGCYVHCESCGHTGRMASTREEAIIYWNDEEEKENES